MSISHKNMISLENVRHSTLLRQASGYIELAEFNMTPDEGVSKPAQKLLHTAIQLLDRLSVTELALAEVEDTEVRVYAD